MKNREEPTLELLRFIEANYPEGVRVLPDNSIAALCPLMFTTSVVLGCSAWGWSKRFCFEDRKRAEQVFNSLVTEDDEPTGWIARRPQKGGPQD